jgi:hypothetical protein
MNAEGAEALVIAENDVPTLHRLKLCPVGGGTAPVDAAGTDDAVEFRSGEEARPVGRDAFERDDAVTLKRPSPELCSIIAHALERGASDVFLPSRS